MLGVETKMQTVEMKVLRLIRQVTKRGKWRNSRIRTGLNIKPILKSIVKSKVQWYEHAV